MIITASDERSDRFVACPIAGIPLVVCLLLGAVVATTDPGAVIAIFRDVGAPGRLTRLVEGEALLKRSLADAAARFDLLAAPIVKLALPVLAADMVC